MAADRGPSTPGRIRRFADRHGLDIHGLGDAIVTQLVDRGLVTDVADLYDHTAADLATVDRDGPRTARNLVHAIDQSYTHVTLARLLYAPGIPSVGRALADTLAARFDSLDELAATANVQTLAQLDGVGPAGRTASPPGSGTTATAPCSPRWSGTAPHRHHTHEPQRDGRRGAMPR